MTIDEADLIAWLDGELAPDDAGRVASAVAADPALARLAEAHRGIAQRLRNGFAPLATEAVPADLVAAASPAIRDNIVDFARPVDRSAPARRFVPPAWTALAATLVVGVITGALVANLGAASPGQRGVVAQDGLARALDTQLASSGQTGAIRIALTFRGRDGKMCRTWSAATQAGVACRADDTWAIKALTTVDAQDSDAYRMAGTDPKLMAEVDAMIVGSPLDSAQEAAARDNAWR